MGFSKGFGNMEDDVRTEIPGPRALHQKPTSQPGGIRPQSGMWGVCVGSSDFVSIDTFPSYTSFPVHCLLLACSPLSNIKSMFNKDLWNKRRLKKGLGLSCLSYIPRGIGRKGRLEVVNLGCMLESPREL